MDTLPDQDEPCTGEPAKAALVYIATADGLYVGAALAIDFYAE